MAKKLSTILCTLALIMSLGMSASAEGNNNNGNRAYNDNNEVMPRNVNAGTNTGEVANDRDTNWEWLGLLGLAGLLGLRKREKEVH